MDRKLEPHHWVGVGLFWDVRMVDVRHWWLIALEEMLRKPKTARMHSGSGVLDADADVLSQGGEGPGSTPLPQSVDAASAKNGCTSFVLDWCLLGTELGTQQGAKSPHSSWNAEMQQQTLVFSQTAVFLARGEWEVRLAFSGVWPKGFWIMQSPHHPLGQITCGCDGPHTSATCSSSGAQTREAMGVKGFSPVGDGWPGGCGQLLREPARLESSPLCGSVQPGDR